VERQTDGPEWVMATLFVIAMIVVIAAAIREIKRLRAGDPGGEPAKRRPKGSETDPHR
jgi:hypothetical protein